MLQSHPIALGIRRLHGKIDLRRHRRSHAALIDRPRRRGAAGDGARRYVADASGIEDDVVDDFACKIAVEHAQDIVEEGAERERAGHDEILNRARNSL